MLLELSHCMLALLRNAHILNSSSVYKEIGMQQVCETRLHRLCSAQIKLLTVVK